MAETNTGILRKATNEGDRALRRTARRFGEDFRELRFRFGVTQAAVARSIGVSRSVICQLEAGDEDVGPRIRARASAALGATFKMALYADAEPMIRDAAHARLIETLLRLRHPGWHATIEAPVPNTLSAPGHRSTDVRIDGARQIVLFEVESRIQRWEELARECHDKQAAVQASAEADVQVHAVLVLPPTHRNRAVIRSLAATARATFPVPDQVLRDALTNQPGPWPGNGILWLPGGRSPGEAGRVGSAKRPERSGSEPE
jgi:transcriptional regulator with XRE-family HTH domain